MLSMQRTTLAYTRTAVAVAGLGRTSSSAAVQYACDAAALLTLLAGIAQHWSFGHILFSAVKRSAADGTHAEKPNPMAPGFFSSVTFFHHLLLVLSILVAAVGVLAASVWMDKLPPQAKNASLASLVVELVSGP